MLLTILRQKNQAHSSRLGEAYYCMRLSVSSHLFKSGKLQGIYAQVSQDYAPINGFGIVSI